MTDIQAALRRIDELAQREMDRSRAPALSMAITDRERIVHLATYGYAELESRTPLGPEHLFEFGSIGKSFTAIVLLQLTGEGVVDLHAPVNAYLPWFEVRSEFAPIDLHHLLTHTAGITRGTDFPADPRYEVWALRETCASTPPGQRFHYSNVGYKALGLVIERVTGKSYAEVVRERILEPLGMTATEPAITHATRARLARGYAPRYDDRPWCPEHGYAPATWLETNTADGCIAATPAELAAYLRMLMNGGRAPGATILDADAYRAMTAPYIDTRTASAGGDRYGYGLAVRYDGERLVSIGHGGGMVGYYALVQADLDAGFGIVTMTTGQLNQERLATYTLAALSAAARGDELPELPELPDRLKVDCAADLAGTYHGDGSSLSLEARGDQLFLINGGGAAALEPREAGASLVHDPEFDRFLLRVERDDEGAVMALHHGERSWYAAGRQRPAAEPPEEWRAYTGHYRSHNPWQSNFRIILRGNRLLLAGASGWEEPLLPIGPATFRVESEDTPETISFDTLVDGEAWRAVYSGAPYYRFFTP